MKPGTLICECLCVCGHSHIDPSETETEIEKKTLPPSPPFSLLTLLPAPLQQPLRLSLAPQMPSATSHLKSWGNTAFYVGRSGLNCSRACIIHHWPIHSEQERPRNKRPEWSRELQTRGVVRMNWEDKRRPGNESWHPGSTVNSSDLYNTIN